MTDDQHAVAPPPWVGRGKERPSQPPTLLALRDLVAAGSRVNHVVSRRAGLSESELVTLEHLSREQIGPAEVARRLEVSTAAATGIVDRLVARGHVERRPHELDRRRTELHITGSGRAEIIGHLMPMFARPRPARRDLHRGGEGRRPALPPRRDGGVRAGAGRLRAAVPEPPSTASGGGWLTARPRVAVRRARGRCATHVRRARKVAGAPPAGPVVVAGVSPRCRPCGAPRARRRRCRRGSAASRGPSRSRP